MSRRGLLAAAATAVESFFLAPADARAAGEPAAPSGQRPVIAVFGLASGCGSTVVARALAAELAARDPVGAAAVSCEARPAGIPLATQPALRLARALEDVPGAAPRAVGRLCLVAGAESLALADCASHFAPLVIDAGSGALGGAPASVADRTIVVTTPAIEPALARVARACVARVGAEPVVVMNRAGPAGGGPDEASPAAGPDEASPAAGDGALAAADAAPHLPCPGGPVPLPGAPLRLPHSRLGAQLALAGREPRGELGRAIARLADRCEEAP